MTKYLALVIFVSICCVRAKAQSQNNHWIFGQYAAIEFTSGTPVSYAGSMMNTYEGCATISDTSGNLLFYSNGVWIWNAQHNYLWPGFPLTGHESTSQSVLIVPSPGNCDLFYVFSQPAVCYTDTLSYSVVDMTGQAGLGEIIEYNVHLRPGTSERLTAVINGNGSGYWVVTNLCNPATFLTYSVSSSGPDTVPVISHIPELDTLNQDPFGYLAASPDGKKLCFTCGSEHRAVLLDMNISTGEISHPVLLNIPYPNEAYGVEFSPSGNRLYVSTFNGIIYQYDLMAGTDSAIQNSVFALDTCKSFVGALMLGHDKKIYFSTLSKHYLGVINSPDEQGSACNKTDSSIFLGAGFSRLGLPNLMKGYVSCFDTEARERISPEPSGFEPNPFSEVSRIRLDQGTEESVQIALYSITGRKVKTTFSRKDNYLYLFKNNLEPGVYFFEISGRNGRLHQGKIMVE